MALQVSEEDFKAWAMHPVTEALRQYLIAQRLGEMENWARQSFVEQTEFGTAVKNAAALGRCEVYAQILDLNFSELNHHADS